MRIIYIYIYGDSDVFLFSNSNSMIIRQIRCQDVIAGKRWFWDVWSTPLWPLDIRIDFAFERLVRTC